MSAAIARRFLGAHGHVADAEFERGKKGCGRMSHQIFLALSMQLVLMSRLTKFSNSPYWEMSGMLVRGNLSKTLRGRFKAGIHAQPEGGVGRERQQVRQEVARAFMSWMAVSRSSTPMWTCRPKMRLARATICRSSTMIVIALVRIDLLLAPVGERVRGAGDQAQTMFIERSRIIWRRILWMSSRGFLDVRQMLVPTSTTDWCISALTRSCRSEFARGRASRCRCGSAGRG